MSRRYRTSVGIRFRRGLNPDWTRRRVLQFAPRLSSKRWTMSDVRKAIIATYAEWTAMSALRSGAPIKSRRDILERTNCVKRIKDIVDYECYRRIIDGCRIAAKALECELIEVEQLWA